MRADGDEQRPDVNLTVHLLLHSDVKGLFFLNTRADEAPDVAL